MEYQKQKQWVDHYSIIKWLVHPKYKTYFLISPSRYLAIKIVFLSFAQVLGYLSEISATTPTVEVKVICF